jgi:hypothetical protein
MDGVLARYPWEAPMFRDFLTPAQRERFNIWTGIVTLHLRNIMKEAGIRSPFVMHVIGPSAGKTQRDLVVIFEGLDVCDREELENIIGPWSWGWASRAQEEREKASGDWEWDQIPGKPTDEITFRVKWKAHAEPGLHDATLSIDWEGTHLEYPVLVRNQDDNWANL